MSDLFFSMIERLTPMLRQGDLQSCEREVAAEMKELAPTSFHAALELSITNDPIDAAHHFDRFFAHESKRFQIGAAYTEMNGFDINPGRWFCDLFAYSTDGGHDDYDWISDWQPSRRRAAPRGHSGLGNQEVDSWQRAAICDVELVAKIHGKKRMLVITAPDNYFRWLCSMADVKDLLKPFPSDLMEAAPVGNRVTPRDDGASLFTVGE